jgi:4-amino-4-deoxy-L-arabinose transferase-like glycosyltransferase
LRSAQRSADNTGNVQPTTLGARVLRLLIWGLLALWTFLGLDRPIGDGDEVIHAQIVRQMIAGGDWLHTRWYSVDMHERSPLTYWLAVPFARVWSSEVGMRLACALLSFATLLLVYRLACKLWSQPTAALSATICLAAAPSYHVFTRTMMSEAPYLFALTVALWGSIEALDPRHARRGLLLAAAGLGVAMALKSFAAALPLVALAPWLLWAQHKRGDRRGALGALVLFTALAGPYFLLSYLADPAQFVQEHVQFHLLQRAQGDFVMGMPGGVLAYVYSITLRDGPVFAALLATSVLAGAYLGRSPGRRALLLLSSYAMLFFIGISLVGTRLAHYILPLYPAAALAGAGALAHARKRFASLQRPVFELVAPALAALVLVASLRYSGGRDALLERPFGKLLGEKAHALAADAKLYAYEWYGLSLGYYAQRPVVLLTAQPERYNSINYPLGPIARAHIAALVPPPPAAEGEPIYIAGHVSDLNNAPWFTVSEIVAAAPPYFLARAVVRTPPREQATLTPR